MYVYIDEKNISFVRTWLRERYYFVMYMREVLSHRYTECIRSRTLLFAVFAHSSKVWKIRPPPVHFSGVHIQRYA